ncbi:MAG: hypothetical protein GY811_02090 [Myxococcales bacterium]|nr:hypothetical protein [Myxococcales bacterium]
MSLEITERLEVLRDEALNTADFGPDAGGAEVFDAILSRVARTSETAPGLDMSLREALNRRLAWGENASAITVDGESVCKRLLAAVLRSFRDPEDTARVVVIIAEVSCTAASHLARNAVQRASKERALQRREMMVQRQLAAALGQQDELIQSYSTELKS